MQLYFRARLASAMLVALMISALLASSELAQVRKQSTGSITGRVIDDGGQPFPYAVVTLNPANIAGDKEREVIADENGSFDIRNLPARAYIIECSSPGYTEDPEDASSVYHLPGEVVTLRLIKGGVITGVVTDSSGEIVVRAKVEAIRVRDGEGLPVTPTETSSEFKSDDRGIYRIYGLEAGSYLVRVDGSGDLNDNHLRNEAPTYFPSATRGSAEMVRVQAGQEASGIDIRLRGEHGHAISGSFSGIAKSGSEGNGIFIKLLHAGSGMIEAEDYFGDDSFAVYGVADGDYFIIAEYDYYGPSAASAPRRISVRGADVTGIELKLIPLASVAGRVIVEVTPKNKPRCKDARAPKFEEMVAAVFRDTRSDAKDQPVSLFDDSVANALDEKGSFALEDLWPGHYRLRMVPINENLFVRSISLRTQGKQTPDPIQNGLSLKSGNRIKGITITLAEGAAEIRGRILPQDEKSKLRARIHLLPAESADDPLRFFETTAQTDGSFVLKNIPPGRYLIYARSLRNDETKETLRPAAWDADSRAAARREAAISGAQIDLQPCQRVSDYALRPPLKK